MSQEPTMSDILAAIAEYASHVDTNMSSINNRLNNVEQHLTSVENRLTKVEAIMVTKDYLDDKLNNLRADLILMARKQNTKLTVLIENLVTQHVLDRMTADKILASEPFPQAE